MSRPYYFWYVNETEFVDARGWTDTMEMIATVHPEVAEDIRNEEMEALVRFAEDGHRGGGRLTHNDH